MTDNTSFVNDCKFTAASAGTGSFVVSAAVSGYQTPLTAGASGGATYHYRAESIDITQWEYGSGTYTSSNVTLSRTPFGNSAGGSSAINFSQAPQVGITALSSDFGQAYITYTPNINCASGSASATGRYRLVGKQCFLSINIFCNVAGTFSGMELPVTAVAGSGTFVGRENARTGVAWTSVVSATSAANLQSYINSIAFSSGDNFLLSGFYEIA